MVRETDEHKAIVGKLRQADAALRKEKINVAAMHIHADVDCFDNRVDVLLSPHEAIHGRKMRILAKKLLRLTRLT